MRWLSETGVIHDEWFDRLVQQYPNLLLFVVGEIVPLVEQVAEESVIVVPVLIVEAVWGKCPVFPQIGKRRSREEVARELDAIPCCEVGSEFDELPKCINALRQFFDIEVFDAAASNWEEGLLGLLVVNCVEVGKSGLAACADTSACRVFDERYDLPLINGLRPGIGYRCADDSGSQCCEIV